MSEEYNGKLIADLYEAKNFNEIEGVFEEIRDIKNPVFVWPLWKNYNKHKDTTYSHYLIGLIGEIYSPLSIDFLKTIILDQDEDVINKVWAINYLKKTNCNLEVDKEVISLLYIIIHEMETSEEKEQNYDLDILLSYLDKTELLHKFQTILQKIFKGDEFHGYNRKSALSYLIKINTKGNIQSFIENYENIRGKTSEIILAKEIITWSGGSADILKELIRTKGGNRAKEIIELKIKKDERKKKEIIIKEIKEFGNAKIVKKISQTKRKINVLAKEKLESKLDLFISTESLIDQTETISSKESLKSICLDLRSCVQEIDSPEHNIEQASALKLIPGSSSENLNKSINKFFLYLKSKEVEIDFGLFGLRDLNKILALIAHPKEEEQLRKILREKNLLELYTNEKWQDVHKGLLRLYEKSLENILSAIISLK